MWQTKYALAVPKKLGLGLNFRTCSEDYFFSGHPQSMFQSHYKINNAIKSGNFVDQQLRNILPIIDGRKSKQFHSKGDFRIPEIKILTQTLNAVRDQSRENFCKVGFFFLPFKKDLSFYFPWIPRTDQQKTPLRQPV